MEDKIIEYFNFCFPIPSESKVIISIDEETDCYVVSVLEMALKSIYCEVKIVNCGKKTKPYEAMSDDYFDIIKDYPFLLDITTGGTYHTELSRRYRDVGGSILVLFGVKKEGLIKIILDADIRKTIQRGVQLKQMFANKKSLHITSTIGTDITMPIKRIKLEINDVKKLLYTHGKQSLLFGQIALPVDYDGANGGLVIKDYVWPPQDLGLLKDPITLTIKNGLITKIDGNSDARHFCDWFDRIEGVNVRKLSHVVLGFIDGVPLADDLVSNERILGALTYGFGEPWNGCKTHIDMVSCDEVISIDGDVLRIA